MNNFKFALSVVEDLKKEYGPNATLDEVLKSIKAPGLIRCPVCNGKGTYIHEYDAYPSGLPDSGWAQDWRYEEKVCWKCDGRGLIPKDS